MPLKDKFKPLKRLFGSRKSKGDSGVNASQPVQSLSDAPVAVSDTPAVGRTSSNKAGRHVQSPVASSAVGGYGKQSFTPHSTNKEPSRVTSTGVKLNAQENSSESGRTKSGYDAYIASMMEETERYNESRWRSRQ